MNASNNSKVKKSYLIALTITLLVSLLLFGCVNCVSAAQNSNYPSPYQCGGADWNIGLPDNIVCTGSVTTIGALEEDSKATLVTGNTNRLRPDLTTMNKFCQGYTGQASSYAVYGRMHNYCNYCDQRLAWFENNQWNSNSVCAPALNVQLVRCATGCKLNVVCSSNSECDDSNAYTYDQCLNPGTAQSSCSHSKITCLSNNDCGTTGFFGNEFCQSNDVFKFYRESTCKNAGTTSSSCAVLETPQFLTECGSGACGNYGLNYCKSNNVYHSRLCNNKGCSAGACYTNYTTDEAVVQTCNYGCANGVCLPECSDNNQCLSNQICSNYNCVNITCKSDLDCDDSKANTVDKCNNPGTTSSSCSHDSVRCNRDSDCGTNGYLNGLFCQNNNVFQNFVTYTCANPGTGSSTCTNSTNPQLKLNCAGKSCSNGQCLDIVCSSNSDCNDNNSSTIDVCTNPGTSSSSCSHNPVICNSNADCNDNNSSTIDVCTNPGTTSSSCSHSAFICSSDANCGTNGYLGQLFCKNNGVFDKYMTYTCANPGTVNSVCSNSTEEKSIKTCELGCSNGQCLTACTLDSDCHADYTEKICANKNVYRDSHDFSCSQGKCVDDTNSELVTKCKYSCDNGECKNEEDSNGGFPIEEDNPETVLISGGDSSVYLGSMSNYTTINKTTQKINVTAAKTTGTNYFWLLLLIALIIIMIIIILVIMFSL